ncbi:MAG: Ig-like domain-containing protein [Candidatus Cryptobacteroides sp.]
MKKFASLCAVVLATSMISCSREASEVKVTGIELSPETLEIEIGEQSVVSATVLPQDAGNKDVVFSSKESVATVSQDGIVEGISAGTAIVTATTSEGNFKAHCIVTVLENISAGTGAASNISCRNAVISGTAKLPKAESAGLSFGILYSTTLDFKEAATVRLEAESCDAENNFSVTTGVLEPETTYYYRSFVKNGGETATGEIKSFETLPASSMIQTLDPSKLTSKECELNASLILKDCIYKELEYGFELSRDGEFAYAKASDNLADGQFSQAASLEAEHEYSYLAYVKLDGRTYKAGAKSFTAPATPVSGVEVSPESVEIKIGGKAALSAVVSPENAGNKAVEFSSDNESVATVSKDGEVKGVSAGTATVTVTTVDGNFKAYCNVKVLESMKVATGSATNISCRNARLAGTAKYPDTQAFEFSFGIMYSTNSDFREESTVRIAAESGAADNSFTIVSGVLEPETTYYYRSYMSDGSETVLGETRSFKTLPASSLIKTLEPEINNPKSSVWKGEFDLTDCVYEKVEKGFGFTMDGSTDTTEADYSDNGLNGSIKEYISTVPGNKYSYRAFVKLDGRTYWGETVTYTAPAIQATVTANVDDTYFISSIIKGKVDIVSEGSYKLSVILYYSTTENTLEGLKAKGIKVESAITPFAMELRPLASDTKYYYAVVAKVDDAEFNTAVQTFTTQKITGKVTAESSEVSFYSARISGNTAATSPGLSVSKSAVLYYSSTASTLTALKSSGTAKTLTLDTNGNYSIDLSIDQDTKYYYTVVMTAYDKEFNSGIKTFTTKQFLVDLGLSVKWASFNLGASSPEGYGGYYMWGGTKDVSDLSYNLSWETCPFHEGKTDPASGWTKYNVNGVPSLTLLPEHDAAHVALGGNWRIATADEWCELKDNCTWTETTLNGVSGYKVQSKVSGYTDKWIFLPKAGRRSGTKLTDTGIDGVYWTSNYIQTSPRNANLFGLPSNVAGAYRYNGLPIRPVISK